MAEVTSVDVDHVELRLEQLDDTVSPRPRCDLVLAMPRPKVLGRILEHVTALGVGTVCLVRTWRVEKSYLQSESLQAPALREHLLAGLEQARDTRVPRVVVAPLFRPLVEDRLDELFPSERRMVCHPEGGESLVSWAEGVEATQRIVVAIGPEGGFTRFEVELLGEHGFSPVNLGQRVLRVETACTAVLARLGILSDR